MGQHLTRALGHEMYLALLALLALALSAPGTPQKGLALVNVDAPVLAGFMMASELLDKSGLFYYVASKPERVGLFALAPVAYLGWDHANERRCDIRRHTNSGGCGLRGRGGQRLSGFDQLGSHYYSLRDAPERLDLI